MLYNFYIIQEALSNFQNKKNVCFYHSFYIYLKQYFPNIMSFEDFLKFKQKDNYFISIEEFTKEYKFLYNYLIEKQPELKNILNNLVLGISKFVEEKNKVELLGFLKLEDLLKNKIHFKSKISSGENPIIILNHQEHFNPIMLKLI